MQTVPAVLDEFAIGFTVQRAWGSLVVMYLFLGGTGAGLFLLGIALGTAPGALIGLLLVGIGGLALLADLGRPRNFWRAFTHPRTSWISRGTYFITLLLLFGVLTLFPRLLPADQVPWLAGGVLDSVIRWLALVAAFLVMVYTGFVLSPSPAIPFWNAALLPLIFLAYSVMTGLGILLALDPVLGPLSLPLQALEAYQVALIGACLLLVLGHLVIMRGSTTAARASTRLLIRGPLALEFVGGVVALGLILPLVITLGALLGRGETFSTFLGVAAVLKLAGDYLFRSVLLRAGLYEPLL